MNRMNSRESALTATLEAALLPPGLQIANRVRHPADNEAGYTLRRDHVTTSRCRRADAQ